MESSTSQPQRYTNDVSAEFLRAQNNSVFTDQQLAELGEEAATYIRQQDARLASHPARAIYRLATEGSRTRHGGVIEQATTQMEFTLDNGQKVRVAQAGDCAVYADGSTASIVTSAGQGNSNLALVGSRLSNGDEIIDTPQNIGLFVQRDGMPMAEDFLPPFEG